MDFPLSPHIAVITNLAPNHLDVHKDMDEYVNAKKNVFLHQGPDDTLVLNMDNALTHAMAAEAPGRILEFSRQSVPENGAYANDGVILWSRHEFKTLMMPQSDILLPGLHNVENYLAAICAVQPFVSVRDIRTVAQNFAGVEHRIELVRVKDGVRFYNDSIASSPSRTIACLRCFPEKIILIAGGYDKHIPYDALGPEICEHVKLLVLTGATAPKIREAVLSCGSARRSCPEILAIDDFTAAVTTAAVNTALATAAHQEPTVAVPNTAPVEVAIASASMALSILGRLPFSSR